MIVLDTSILVYSVGADHPLAVACRELLTEVHRGRVRATTTVEVIQAFSHVWARRRSRAEAADLSRPHREGEALN